MKQSTFLNTWNWYWYWYCISEYTVTKLSFWKPQKMLTKQWGLHLFWGQWKRSAITRSLRITGLEVLLLKFTKLYLCLWRTLLYNFIMQVKHIMSFVVFLNEVCFMNIRLEHIPRCLHLLQKAGNKNNEIFPLLLWYVKVSAYVLVCHKFDVDVFIVELFGKYNPAFYL